MSSFSVCLLQRSCKGVLIELVSDLIRFDFFHEMEGDWVCGESLCIWKDCNNPRLPPKLPFKDSIG